MKKLLHVVVALMLLGSLSAQNVARECVLFEIFTGVNCPYCPAAANGINQMMEEGLAIAPVAVHTSAFSTSDYYTSETNARANFYGITSYPTLKADGKLSRSGGGSASESMYTYYKNFYNQRIGISSPFTIDLSYTFVEGSTCKVTAVVNQVGECTAGNLKVMIALTESHIQRAWQGMTELNAVTRDFIPTQNGTAFTGTSTTVTGTFDMAGYDKENMHIVAWVQSFTTKEVFQAVRISMEPQQTSYDVALRNVNSVITTNCSGVAEQRMTLKTFGTETVTSMEIEVTDENNNVITTYQWTGDEAHGETFDVVMPEFDINGANVLNFNVKKINGNDDAYPFDNFVSVEVEDAGSYPGDIKVQLKTAISTDSIYLEIKNMTTNEVFEEYHFEHGKTYQFDVYLPEPGCYRFTFINPEGTGCDNGFGRIKDIDGNIILKYSSHDERFVDKIAGEMDCTTAGVHENQAESIVVYPNPASSEININGENITEVRVYNALGQLVYSKTDVDDNLTIDATTFDEGLYLVNIKNINGEESSQKIIIKK